MKRKDIINRIKYAGYHANNAAFIRLYAENKISYNAAQAAFKAGDLARKNGVKCNCFQCLNQNK